MAMQACEVEFLDKLKELAKAVDIYLGDPYWNRDSRPLRQKLDAIKEKWNYLL